MSWYEDVFCNECGEQVCQSCGCCQNSGCERCSCPDVERETEEENDFKSEGEIILDNMKDLIGKLSERIDCINQPPIQPIICCGMEVKNGMCYNCGKQFRKEI